MKNHIELRQTYLGAAPSSIVVGTLWILSGIISNYSTTRFAILFFFIATAVNFPIGELFRKLFKVKNRMSPENNLPKLFSWLSFTIPLSIPVVYLAVQYNINWFFPAFAIIIGAHYLPFVWAYRMPSFAILGVLIIASATYIAIYYSNSFDLSAYSTGGLIILFGIIHLFIVKKEIRASNI